MAGEKPLPPAVGLNFWGRPGLVVQDTCQIFPAGRLGLSAGMDYQSYGDRDNFLFPVGVNWGTVENLNLYANGHFLSTTYKVFGKGNISGMNRLSAGGVYVFKNILSLLDAGVAFEASFGPVSSALGRFTTDYNPRIISTCLLENKILLTTEWGLYLAGGSYPAYVQYSLGAAWVGPVMPMVEFLHHTMGGPDSPGTICMGGVRTSGEFQFQGFIGLYQSSTAPDYVTGFSVIVST